MFIIIFPSTNRDYKTEEIESTISSIWFCIKKSCFCGRIMNLVEYCLLFCGFSLSLSFIYGFPESGKVCEKKDQTIKCLHLTVIFMVILTLHFCCFEDNLRLFDECQFQL